MPGSAPFDGVFAGKTVLVTGHTGFKGAWLSLWLLELGAEVVGYSLEPPTQPNLFEHCGLADRMDSRPGDVRDTERLRALLTEIRPDAVFHLAAQSLVRRSYREPGITFDTNVMGTVNLLDAVRAVDCVRVCQVVTSDKCYANREWTYAYRENDTLGGHDPYSASKGAAELVVSCYRDAFFPPGRIAEHGVSLSSARAGNVIGGGDWAEDRIVPDCIRALSSGTPIHVRNPHAIRPWQYVLEPLAGYLWLAARQFSAPAEQAEPWNFGPEGGGELSVRELVEQVLACWGEPASRAVYAADADDRALHEASFLSLDCSKAHRLLGWRVLLSAEESIERSVRWYREMHGDGDALEACRREISGYMETASAREAVWAAGPKVASTQRRPRRAGRAARS